MKRIFTLLLFFVANLSQAQWQQCPNQPFPPFGGLAARSFLSNGNTLWASVGSFIMTTDDNGNTWDTIDAKQGLFTGISGIASMNRLGNKFFVSISGNGNTNVFSSLDNGQSWTLDTAGWPGIQIPGGSRLALTSTYNVSNKALVGKLESNFTIYQLPGDTAWRTMSVPDEFRTSATMVMGDTLYFCNSNKLIYTTDLGQNWSTRTFNIPGTFYQRSFTTDGVGTMYTVMINFPAQKSQIYRSTNFGHTWDSLNWRAAVGKDIGWIYPFPAGLMVTTYGFDSTNKALSSVDGGNTWFDMSKGMSHLVQYHFQNFGQIHLHNGTYFTGYAEGGVFRSSNFVTGIKNDKAEVKMLVYPNPANTSFELKSEQQALSINLYDLQGKLIRNWEPAERYELEDLTRGTYILQVAFKEGLSHQKLIIQ